MVLSGRYAAWAPWLAVLVGFFVLGPVHWFMKRDWAIRMDQPVPVQLLSNLVFAAAVATLVAAVVVSVRWVRVATPDLRSYLGAGDRSVIGADPGGAVAGEPGRRVARGGRHR